MVIDSSVILAIYFNEPNAAWAAELLNQHAGQLLMSTVNVAEVLIRTRDRQPALADELETRLLNSGIRDAILTLDHDVRALDRPVVLPP